jgi:hypothetical protein
MLPPCAPSPALLTAPVPASLPLNQSAIPNMTAGGNNPLQGSAAMAFTGAQHVDASHAAISVVGGNATNITHNYHGINSRDLPRNAASEPQVSHQPMPCHNELFTGREDYLERLRRYFVPRNEARPRRSVLIYGMGGAGKTQICLKFVEDNSER